jgi:hypothetical protein
MGTYIKEKPNMTTRIGTGGPATGVSALPSAARVTAPPARPFSAAMSAGASAILSGAEQAVTRLPGGPILAAALRAPAPGVGVAPGAPTTLAPEGTAGTAASAAAGPAGGVGVGGVSGESGGIEAALNQSANQNLYFIEIQEKISAENRNYSTISNVLKARHDTVKNAIGNIR